MNMNEQAEKIIELLKAGDITTRSCWNCNTAHEHHKTTEPTEIYICFACGNWYLASEEVNWFSDTLDEVADCAKCPKCNLLCSEGDGDWTAIICNATNKYLKCNGCDHKFDDGLHGFFEDVKTILEMKLGK